MAFLSKFGSILKQAAHKEITAQAFASRPSIYQAIRCMSTSKLFVGGIPYGTDDHSLREAFEKYGRVLEARVVMDRESGRSRGFGFVTFSSSEEASVAIQGLNGQELHGRRVSVTYATNRRPDAGGGYGAGAGNYGSNPSYGGGAGRDQYGIGNTFGSSGSFGGGNAYGSGGGGSYGGGNTFGSGGSDYGVAGGSGGTDTFAQGDISGGFHHKFHGVDQNGGDFGNNNDQFGDINEFGDMEGANMDDDQASFDNRDNDSGVAKSA